MVALRGRGSRCAERMERARVHAPRARIRSQQAAEKMHHVAHRKEKYAGLIFEHEFAIR